MSVITRLKLTAMGLLVAAALFVAVRINHSWQWFVALALAISWLGDALLARVPFLTKNLPDPFIAGMGAFAVAQIMYIIAFTKSMVGMPQLHMRTPGLRVGAEVVGALLPIYILTGVFIWLLMAMRADQPKGMKIVSLVYCVLLTSMGACAFAAGYTGERFIWMLAVGGGLFIISDGFIASHIFRGSLQNPLHYELAVWGTYLPAQLLLMLGTASLY